MSNNITIQIHQENPPIIQVKQNPAPVIVLNPNSASVIRVKEISSTTIKLEAKPTPQVTFNSLGVKGDKGDPGQKGDLAGFFEFQQSVPNNVWTITHNLGFYPSITIVDSANDVVVGDIKYININTIQASFNGGFAGKAYLS